MSAVYRSDRAFYNLERAGLAAAAAISFSKPLLSPADCRKGPMR
jgi:hypothetical protein